MNDNGLVDGKLVFVATPQDYADGKYVPGTYTVTVRGQPARATDLRTDDATFDIVLLDPCDPPTSLTGPGYSDIAYTLTDTAIPQNWIEFNASRGLVTCPVIEYEITYTTLAGGESTVTATELVVSEKPVNWSIFWDTDNSPLG